MGGIGGQRLSVWVQFVDCVCLRGTGLVVGGGRGLVELLCWSVVSFNFFFLCVFYRLFFLLCAWRIEDPCCFCCCLCLPVFGTQPLFVSLFTPCGSLRSCACLSDRFYFYFFGNFDSD